MRVSLYKETAEAILMVVDQEWHPEKDRLKVFDYFYWAENARSISGTELFLCKDIDAHGSIKLTEGVEGGTNAIVRLTIEA